MLEHIWGSEDPSSSSGTSVMERLLGNESETCFFHLLALTTEHDWELKLSFLTCKMVLWKKKKRLRKHFVLEKVFYIHYGFKRVISLLMFFIHILAILPLLPCLVKPFLSSGPFLVQSTL